MRMEKKALEFTLTARMVRCGFSVLNTHPSPKPVHL